MKIIRSSDGKSYKVRIAHVEAEDFKRLIRRRYFFDWKEEKGREVYKLTLTDSLDILGLISIERIPEEWRIHIRLLTVSAENKGREKVYERVAGNLITYVSTIALREYGELACVSLKPKDAIRHHYIEKYGMQRTGITLSVDITGIIELIDNYGYE
jgi:hypothetical protein